MCEGQGKLALRHGGGPKRRAGAWVPWELRPYQRSRCAEHEEVVGVLWERVCPPHRV